MTAHKFLNIIKLLSLWRGELPQSLGSITILLFLIFVIEVEDGALFQGMFIFIFILG